MRRFFRLLAYCVLLGSLLTPPFARAEDGSKEYLIKAAFIYNFVKFIDWPGAKMVAKNAKIDICMLGNDGLRAAQSVFKQASTPSLSLNLVQENAQSETLSRCHIVFIDKSEAGHYKEILANLNNQPVLTVSDIDHFAENGGMVGFVLQENKIKLAINPKAAAAAGLKVNAQLLEIAVSVVGG